MSTPQAPMPKAPTPESASAPGLVWTTLRAALPLAVGISLALLMHFILGPYVGPFYGKLLLDIGINIVLAVSLNIVNGFTGQFSLGHAGFMAVGGYTAGTITYYGSMKLWGSALQHGGFFGPGELLFVGACVAGGLMAALAGLIVGAPSLRLRGDYLAIVTLGFGEIFRVIIQRSGGVLFDARQVAETPWHELATRVGGSLGFNGLPFYTSIFWVYVFVSLTIIAAYRLKTSSFGRAFLSVREDETAASALGVPVFKYKVRAFVLAAFFAGIGGALFAHEVGTTLNPRELGFMRSFEIVIMVVLGGMGSISGAVLAAILITLLPEVLRGFAEYRMIIYPLSLITIMILRPQGLLGVRELWDLKPVRRLLRRKEPAA